VEKRLHFQPLFKNISEKSTFQKCGFSATCLPQGRTPPQDILSVPESAISPGIDSKKSKFVFVAWRNRFLGVDSWAPLKFTNACFVLYLFWPYVCSSSMFSLLTPYSAGCMSVFAEKLFMCYVISLH
jgi:hypothetical protein